MNATKNIKILVIEPNKAPYEKTIKNSISEIYEIVYFPFEILEIEKGIFLISSLAAKEIKDNIFKANRIYKDKIIYSNFAIVGKKNSDFTSLNKEQVKKYIDVFSLENDKKLNVKTS